MAKNTATSSGMSRVAIKRRALLMIGLLLVCGSIAYPRPLNWVIRKTNAVVKTNIPMLQTPFVLGLDLQGGTRLEYSADVSKIAAADRKTALDGVWDVIERRVNSIGVSEPLIQTAQAGNDWRLSVELAGIRDVNQAIKLIGETPILEFKEQNDQPARQLTDEERKKMTTDNAAIEKKAKDVLVNAQKDPSNFAKMVDVKDLGFIKDKPENQEIFDAVKNDAAGTVHGSLITSPQYDIVAKVEESKDAGSEIKANHLLISFAGAQSATSTRTKDTARQMIEGLKKQVTAQNFIEMAKKYSEEPGASGTAGDLGWFGKGVMVPAFEDPAFKLAKGQISDVVESPFGFHLIFKSDERPLHDVRVLAVSFKKTLESDILPPPEPFKSTELTGKNLQRSQLDFDQRNGIPQVSMQFDSEGTKLFAAITKRNVGKPVAIYLDGKPISTPIVNSEIPDGRAVINGSFSVEEAKLLAQRLNAGALPVPISLIAQQSVGPTLGQDSIRASLIAGLWGFLLVAFFMIMLYRLPGLLAIGTLTLYVAISATVFKLVPVTLSLSGIAGFILSIGIAVDANVLIFERLKEELRSGKALKNALEEAFTRAWPSIRDGNFTTLISCAVLYWFTSSVIKGFALTLGVGVLLSMFSAIIAARTILRYVVGLAWVQQSSWLFPRGKAPSSDRS